MKYYADNMFNGVAKELAKAGIESEMVIQAIWGDRDSSVKGRYDAKIFRFLLEKKYRVKPLEEPTEDCIVITADKDLARYCSEFDIRCELVNRTAPPTKAESEELAKKIIARHKPNST
ncbi:MAG TPA: hypothetical protein VLY21_02875 [Nitrososphaerales archaeon]|nr:hypothetical protein [Nitrososphaerales archaeon]